MDREGKRDKTESNGRRERGRIGGEEGREGEGEEQRGVSDGEREGVNGVREMPLWGWKLASKAGS